MRFPEVRPMAASAGSTRIGEEIGKVPKAKGGGQLGKNGITAQGKSTGRTDAMPSGTQRARYQKLAAC
jgi:hypothetical protein